MIDDTIWTISINLLIEETINGIAQNKIQKSFGQEKVIRNTRHI